MCFIALLTISFPVAVDTSPLMTVCADVLTTETKMIVNMMNNFFMNPSVLVVCFVRCTNLVIFRALVKLSGTLCQNFKVF